MEIRGVVVILCLATGLIGCSGNFGLPQSRAEFVKVYKNGGMFRNAEHHTINRPKQAVVADLQQYVEKCLYIKITTTIRQGYSTDRSTATLHPKIVESKGGMTSLSVQETYRDKPEKGHPPGGLYTLVAELRAHGSQTQLDIYHAGRGEIADPLKKWAQGDTGSCPKF